jgi:nucleotide-binding universal stress UspA family protein
MHRNILVPLDESNEAEVILAEVQRIASMRDHVYLLHVMPPQAFPAGLPAADGVALLEGRLKHLAMIRSRWLPDQPGLDLVKAGDPAEEILGVALEKNINLIAMSTHGRSPMGRFLMGSVATEVVRKSELPVLLLRPGMLPSAGTLERILVAVDGMVTPEHLLETVKTLADGPKAEIILFHVMASVVDPAPVWAYPDRLSILNSPEGRLKSLADALKHAGFAARSIVSDGDPVEEILAQARYEEVDLIALATHGRQGLERLVEGSVAEGVLRRSPVAVLLQKLLTMKKTVIQEERHA